MIFEFDDCVLDIGRQELRRAGDAVHVEPQVLAVLAYLAQHADRVVTKIELLDEVWGDRFVSESALTSRIKLARKACGDNGRDQRILKTVHSRGYRFVCAVDVRDDAPDARTPPVTPVVAIAHQPPAPMPADTSGAMRAATSVVGREDELTRLRAALSDAMSGRRRAVFVCGGLGTGKTTLVAEFLERIDNPDDVLVAHGRCFQTRGGVEPYFCLLDALGSLARTDTDLVTSVLEHVAPSWLAQMPQLLDPGAVERLERRLLGSTPSRMLREGVEAIGALARARPLVLVLEDLHLTDDCTLDVIELLLQRSDPTRLLLIGTGRPEGAAIGSLIEPATATGRATSIDLRPLEHDDVAQLASDRLGGARIADELVDIVARRSGGVPLFAEEIVLAWRRRGLLTIEDDLAVPTAGLDLLERTIPTTLPPLIERELVTLDAEERTVLEACAVAGETFAAATVAAALGRPVPTTEDALVALARRHGMVGATGAESWPDGTISATYAFTQQLFRQVIADRIAPSRRAELHGRVGTALLNGHRDRAGDLALVLADHFAEAGQTAAAVEQWCIAGELANARSAHAHAIGFLDRALDAVAMIADADDRRRAALRVRMTLGPALVATRGWFHPSVSENYELALDLCGDDTTGADGAAARYGLATVSELRGQFERTEALLAPLLVPEADAPLTIEAHELVACSMFHQGAFDRSLRTARTVLDEWDEDTYSVLMARIAEHPASSCSSWSSLALWALGRSDESLQLAEHAVELGEQNRYALSTAVQQRAMLHQLRREPDECIDWAERCREVGEDQNFPMRTIQADLYKGWALALNGETADGVRLIERGIDRFRDAGATLNEAYYLGLNAEAETLAGHDARAGQLLDEADSKLTSRTYFYEAELRRLRAQLQPTNDTGGFERARRLLDEAMTIARDQGAVAWQLRIAADRLVLEERADDAGGASDVESWRTTVATLLRDHVAERPLPDVLRGRRLLAGSRDEF